MIYFFDSLFSPKELADAFFYLDMISFQKSSYAKEIERHSHCLALWCLCFRGVYLTEGQSWFYWGRVEQFFPKWVLLKRWGRSGQHYDGPPPPLLSVLMRQTKGWTKLTKSHELLLSRCGKHIHRTLQDKKGGTYNVTFLPSAVST